MFADSGANNAIFRLPGTMSKITFGDTTFMHSSHKILLVLFTVLSFMQSRAQQVRYFDADWKPSKKEDAAYYRKIRYDANGKPAGLVRDYYISGKLQWIGKLLSDNPETNDSVCIWFYENGKRSSLVHYKEG